MKIFSTKQIKSWDTYTIERERITSLELMERASNVFVSWFIEQFPNKTTPIYIFCGNGNNGGDGFVISRLLHQESYKVNVIAQALPIKRSKDNEVNLNAIHKISDLKILTLSNSDDFPSIENDSIVVDALFGTGLKSELRGFFKNLVRFLNKLNVIRVAVDIPS